MKEHSSHPLYKGNLRGRGRQVRKKHRENRHHSVRLEILVRGQRHIVFHPGWMRLTVI